MVLLFTAIGIFLFVTPCLCDEIPSHYHGNPLTSLYNHGDCSEVVLPALPLDSAGIDSLQANFKNPKPLGFQIAFSELSVVHLTHAESHRLNVAGQSDVATAEGQESRRSGAFVSDRFSQNKIPSPSLLLDLSASVLAGVCPTSRFNNTVATRILPSHCPQVSYKTAVS